MSHREPIFPGVRPSRTTVLAIVLAAVVTGCGGGSGDDPSSMLSPNGGGSSALAASFTPDEPAPPPESVTMVVQSVSGNTVAVGFDVTGVSDIGSAGFDLLYDPEMVQFVGWSLGTLFPPCNSGSTLCLVDSSLPGRVVFGISATGGASVDAPGQRTLVRVVLRALEPGSSAVAFDQAALKDAAISDIPGIAWHGGALLAN